MHKALVFNGLIRFAVVVGLVWGSARGQGLDNPSTFNGKTRLTRRTAEDRQLAHAYKETIKNILVSHLDTIEHSTDVMGFGELLTTWAELKDMIRGNRLSLPQRVKWAASMGMQGLMAVDTDLALALLVQDLGSAQTTKIIMGRVLAARLAVESRLMTMFFELTHFERGDLFRSILEVGHHPLASADQKKRVLRLLSKALSLRVVELNTEGWLDTHRGQVHTKAAFERYQQGFKAMLAAVPEERFPVSSLVRQNVHGLMHVETNPLEYLLKFPVPGGRDYDNPNSENAVYAHPTLHQNHDMFQGWLLNRATEVPTHLDSAQRILNAGVGQRTMRKWAQGLLRFRDLQYAYALRQALRHRGRLLYYINAQTQRSEDLDVLSSTPNLEYLLKTTLRDNLNMRVAGKNLTIPALCPVDSPCRTLKMGEGVGNQSILAWLDGRVGEIFVDIVDSHQSVESIATFLNDHLRDDINPMISEIASKCIMRNMAVTPASGPRLYWRWPLSITYQGQNTTCQALKQQVMGNMAAFVSSLPGSLLLTPSLLDRYKSTLDGRAISKDPNAYTYPQVSQENIRTALMEGLLSHVESDTTLHDMYDAKESDPEKLSTNPFDHLISAIRKGGLFVQSLEHEELVPSFGLYGQASAEVVLRHPELAEIIQVVIAKRLMADRSIAKVESDINKSYASAMLLSLPMFLATGGPQTFFAAAALGLPFGLYHFHEAYVDYQDLSTFLKRWAAYGLNGRGGEGFQALQDMDQKMKTLILSGALTLLDGLFLAHASHQVASLYLGRLRRFKILNKPNQDFRQVEEFYRYRSFPKVVASNGFDRKFRRLSAEKRQEVWVAIQLYPSDHAALAKALKDIDPKLVRTAWYKTVQEKWINPAHWIRTGYRMTRAGFGALGRGIRWVGNRPKVRSFRASLARSIDAATPRIITESANTFVNFMQDGVTKFKLVYLERYWKRVAWALDIRASTQGLLNRALERGILSEGQVAEIITKLHGGTYVNMAGDTIEGRQIFKLVKTGRVAKVVLFESLELEPVIFSTLSLIKTKLGASQKVAHELLEMFSGFDLTREQFHYIYHAVKRDGIALKRMGFNINDPDQFRKFKWWVRYITIREEPYPVAGYKFFGNYLRSFQNFFQSGWWHNPLKRANRVADNMLELLAPEFKQAVNYRNRTGAKPFGTVRTGVDPIGSPLSFLNSRRQMRDTFDLYQTSIVKKNQKLFQRVDAEERAFGQWANTEQGQKARKAYSKSQADELTEIYWESIRRCHGGNTYSFATSRGAYKDTAMVLAVGSMFASYTSVFLEKEEGFVETVTDQYFVLNFLFDWTYIWFSTWINSRIQMNKNINFPEKYLQDQGIGTFREAWIIWVYPMFLKWGGKLPGDAELEKRFNEEIAGLSGEEAWSTFKRKFFDMIQSPQFLKENPDLVDRMEDIKARFQRVSRILDDKTSEVDAMLAKLEPAMAYIHAHEADPDALEQAANSQEVQQKKQEVLADLEDVFEELNPHDRSEVFSEDLHEALAIRHYQDMSGTWKTGNFGTDKYVYRRAMASWEAVPSILRNMFVYRMLCFGRYTPVQAFWAAAATYFFEKYFKNLIVLDYRKEALGPIGGQ